MNTKRFLHAGLSLALILCLLLTGMPALAASAAQGPVNVGATAGGAVVGDTLYFTGDKLRAYTPGQEAAVDLADMPENAAGYTLSNRDGELWRIDNLTGIAARWNGTDFEDQLQLDWDGLDNPNEPRRLLWPVWTADALYALITQAGGAGAVNGWEMLRFDIAGGERETLPATNIWQLAPYKDGQLLAFSLNVMQAAQQNDGGGRIITLDAEGQETGELFKVVGLMDGGIAYDAANDAVYVVSGGQLMASRGGGAFEGGAYVSASQPLNNLFAGVTAGGQYAVLSGEELYLTDTQPGDAVIPPLRIKGLGVDAALVQDFQRENPDIPVALVDSLSTDVSEIIADFTSQENQTDIFVLFTFQALNSLKEKGYLSDLTDIPGVAQRVSELYPFAQDALKLDGRIYALPAAMTGVTWRVNEALMEQFGFEMPKTMLEYYQMLERWELDYAEDEPDYTFSPIILGKEQCISYALQDYALTYETPDKPLQVDTPAFRRVLEAIEALPYEPVDLDALAAGDTSMLTNGLQGKRALIETINSDAFNRYGPRDEEGKPETRVVPPPPFEEGGPATQLMGQMSVYLINPNSPNRAQAERFIAYAAEHMPTDTRLMLSPDYNEPQRPEGYQVGMDQLQKEIDELTARLEDPAAEEADRRGVEEALAAKQAEKADREADDWDVSAQAIADYRAVAEQMNLLTHSSVVSIENPAASQELNNLLIRYMKGDAPLDQTLRELDKRFQMIYMEN